MDDRHHRHRHRNVDQHCDYERFDVHVVQTLLLVHLEDHGCVSRECVYDECKRVLTESKYEETVCVLRVRIESVYVMTVENVGLSDEMYRKRSVSARGDCLEN